ncbi:MAG: hypothetical protein JWR21_2843 [Herminiimonas sp.]|nr:hypothetical protein [Herminiimonas sp.]
MEYQLAQGDIGHWGLLRFVSRLVTDVPGRPLPVGYFGGLGRLLFLGSWSDHRIEKIPSPAAGNGNAIIS